MRQLGKGHSRALAAVCAAVAVALLNEYLQWPTEMTHRFLLIAAVIVLAMMGAYWFALTERRLRACSFVAGFAFSLAQVAGERISNVGTLAEAGFELLCLLLGALLLAPSAGGVFAWLMQKISTRKTSDAPRRLSERAVLWGSAGVILLLWLPLLAAFYPGLYTYDVSYQHLMYFTGEFNTHHPLLHTLMVGGFCRFGEMLFGFPIKGLLMLTVFQMLLMALVMASAIQLLYRHRAPTWLCVLLLAGFALLPFNSLLAISTTKDTLFAGAVLWLTLLLMQAAFEPDAFRRPWWMIRFALANAFTLLMRNNGFICVLAAMAVALLWLKRHPEAAKRMLALSLAGLIAGLSINAGLKAATNAQSGPVQEMLSVPVQQLARVYVLTDDPDKAEIERYLPAAAKYSTSLSDMVKNTFAGADDLTGFLRLWAKVGVRHPVIYLDAFVAMSKGFYQLDEVPPMGGQYLETAFHTDILNNMVESSKWPWLRDAMAQLYSRRGYLDVPLWGAFLSHALWCWVMLWAVLAAFYLRNRAVLSAGLLSLLLFATVLLGPCVMLRYIYPLMLTGPVLWGGLLTRRTEG